MGESGDAVAAGAGATIPLMILNPAGGGGRARRLHTLLEHVARQGRAALVATKGPGDAERLAREAAAAGRDVIAAGGDGTISEVANGILAAGTGVALGIVPGGTGNDYACRTLGLPSDPQQAMEIALTGLPVAMDVGQLNDRYFTNSAGVGIDANINVAAGKLKRVPLLRGEALYYAASLSELIFHYDRCPELSVAVDGEPATSRHYAVAALTLGPTYGGGFHINPGADPHDGLLDLCMLSKPSQLRALRLLPLVEKGRHLGQPEVTQRRVRAVTMVAATPIYGHLDGEVMRAQHFAARVLPAALRVRQLPPAARAPAAGT